MFISGDVTPQSLDPEVLLKVKSEIEEELKSLDKEVSEGLSLFPSWAMSTSVSSGYCPFSCFSLSFSFVVVIILIFFFQDRVS